MAQYNGNFQKVVLTDNGAPDTISLTVTSGAAADDIAVAFDSGTGVTVGSSPYTGVQSLVLYTKNYRILVEYNTPVAQGSAATLALTV